MCIFFVFFLYCSYANVYKYTHVYYVYQDEWIVKMCFWWVNQKNNNNNKILGPSYLRPRDLHRFLCPSISVRITFNSSWASEHQFVLTITCLITKFIICTYTYTYLSWIVSSKPTLTDINYLSPSMYFTNIKVQGRLLDSSDNFWNIKINASIYW